MLYYSVVSDKNGKTLTVFTEDGDPLTVTADHPNFSTVYQGVTADTLSEEDVKRLLDLTTAAGTKLTALSERVSLQGNTLYFDGDVIDNAIAGHIVRLVGENDDTGWQGLVRFLEKIQTNPNEHSIDSLYSWLGRNFTITPDGDIIAYKGVRPDEKGVNLSVSSGTAIVNGVVHKGRIPNPDGAVVEMPRSDVQHDSGVGCSTGLHAGTYDYALSFVGHGGKILIVQINPRDVVSVPTDCSAQKVRVCRYTVLTSVDAPIATTTYSEPDIIDDDEDEDYDDEEYCYTCDDGEYMCGC